MTPVMTRCAHGWPIAECLQHSPPAMFAPAIAEPGPAPDDDPDGLAQPAAVHTVIVVASTVLVLDLAVLVGLTVCAVKAAEWLLRQLG